MKLQAQQIVPAVLLSATACWLCPNVFAEPAAAAANVPAPAPPLPFFNKVAYKASHNSYWVKRDNIVEAFASGIEERIVDQLAFEGVRSLELDIHRDDPHPHQFTIYHTDRGSNSTCLNLDECLKQIALFHRAIPQHDPLTIVLEMKETGFGSPFDSNHTPEDLDAILEKYAGPYIYRPKDLLARCRAGSTVRSCLQDRAWPTIRELRGKILFAIIGNFNGVAGPAATACGPHSIKNHGAWVLYANRPGGIASRSAFLMESPWITGSIACQTEFSQPQVDTAVAASAFVQQQAGKISDFVCQAGTANCAQNWIKANLVVRVDYGGDNKPTLDQQKAAVQAGVALIQNDHPWNSWGDSMPLRSAIPMTDLAAAHPDVLYEPGHRIYASILRDGERVLIPQAWGFGVPALVQWETLVSVTRPATDSDFPNRRRPRGVGCIYAQSDNDSTGTPAFAARICRGTADGHFNVQKPLGEDVVVTVDITQNHRTVTTTSYSDNNTTRGSGELIRLDVAKGTANPSTCIVAYTSEEVNGNSPNWRTVGRTCLPAVLGHQGLSAEKGDVLFSGANYSFANAPGAPPAATTFFEPFDDKTSAHVVYNMSWPKAR